MNITPLKSAAALADAKRALDSVGVPFCLFLGTALGAYRDHDFCPGDVDDIDLGIHIDHFARMDEIKKAMERHGLSEGSHFDGGVAPERAFVRRHGDETGDRTKIDLFFLVPKDGKFLWSFYTDPPQARISSNFFTSFDSVEFYGTEYNIPFPIENYLEENYGKDWKTPIPRDRWVWHRDNQTPIS